MHLIREGGTNLKLLDLLDERMLTPGEVRMRPALVRPPASASPARRSAMRKLRIVMLGILGGRSLTRPFRDARRFPSTRL
jgi:hypothetical protein